MIGASGAISAVLGAYLVLFPGARIQSLVYLGLFYQLIAVPAVLVLGFWFALNLFDAIGWIGAGGETGVAFFAHVTGFIAGVLLALPFRLRRQPHARAGGLGGIGDRPAPGRPGRPRGIIPTMDGDRGTEIEMIVESVRVHMPTGRHVLVLREVDAVRLLMVWVGPWEASAIAMKLQGLTPERPLTHDLFATVLTTLDVTVERIVITDLADETYHARLELSRNGERHEIDARPSDAIALAVRMGVPVFASSDVLDRAGTVPDEDDDDDEAEEGEEAGATATRRRKVVDPETTGEVLDQTRLAIFREFVNSLDPEGDQRGGPSTS